MVERVRFTESRIPWHLRYLQYIRARGFFAEYHRILTGDDCVKKNMEDYLRGADRIASEDHLPFDELAARAAFASGVDKAQRYVRR